jgi:hypothetical protein
MTPLTLVPTKLQPVRRTQYFRSGGCPGLPMAPAVPYVVIVSSNDASGRNPPELPRC